MGLTTLRNATAVAQSVVYRGRQVVIEANGEESFDKELAEHFLSMRSPLVTKKAVSSTSFDGMAGDMVWLANVTGNKELPETISWRENINKQWVEVSVPNPKRKEITSKRMFDLGMKRYVAKDGAPEALNLGKMPIVIGPRDRVMLPKHIASWFMNRESRSEKSMQGCVIKSRAPTGFEPTREWPLDDIRAYFRLLDPKADVGPSEAEVREIAAKDEVAVSAGPSGAQAYVDAARKDLVDRIFYRVADPQYTPPTKEEFTEFVSGAAQGGVRDSDAIMGIITSSHKEVKKRKRGRPRKKPLPEQAVVSEPTSAG